MHRTTIIFFALASIAMAVAALAGLGDVRLPNNHQGHNPPQPLPFSHRLHAGMLEIQCQYCHTSSEEGKHATIPGTSTCMSCHSVVPGKSDTAKEGIAKLLEAHNSGLPVRWRRVHNLADFVHFDHSAHTTAGVACQTCHGDVQLMGTARQHSDLSMGWCVNCHRTENLNNPARRAPLDCAACHR